MPSLPELLPLVAIIGPTAVGKTEIAIQLAERLNAEIVSADSRLLYRGMDVGTAKPTLAERARVPHHLIDVADPDETWSLARYQEAASQAIAGIQQRGKLALLVGGTGQYIRAIVEGWAPPKLPPQQALRKVLASWVEEIGGRALHDRLAVVDPIAAGNIDARNVRRTLRALEVIFTTGQRFSAQRMRGQSPYRLFQVGLTRSRGDLYARIDARIEHMLQTGWLQEVSDLLAKGYSPSLPSISAIGYAQLCAHIQGHMVLEDAKVEIRRKSRLFVRRQAAWFRPSDLQIEWFDAAESNVVDRIGNAVKGFLNNP
jgi:tRNA dimethylallyltransferase